MADFMVSPVIGVLTSLVSAYYYLRVVVIMFMRDGEPQTEHESFLDLTTAPYRSCDRSYQPCPAIPVCLGIQCYIEIILKSNFKELLSRLLINENGDNRCLRF